jgi:hypothetical protein
MINQHGVSPILASKFDVTFEGGAVQLRFSFSEDRKQGKYTSITNRKV